MDQQFEEMNNKLNSVTDPTGFLRMVRRNNLFNRCVWALSPRPKAGNGTLSADNTFAADAPSSCFCFSGLCHAFAEAHVTLPQPHAPPDLGVTAAPPGEVRKQCSLDMTICVWLGTVSYLFT